MFKVCLHRAGITLDSVSLRRAQLQLRLLSRCYCTVKGNTADDRAQAEELRSHTPRGWDRQDRRSIRNKYSQRREAIPRVLSHRKLSVEELEEDHRLEECLDDLKEEDSFGTLGKTSGPTVSGRRRSHISESRYKAETLKSIKFDVSELDAEWEENFGTLPKEVEGEEEALEDDIENMREETPHIRLSNTDRVHPPDWYARKMRKFAMRGDVDKVFEVFDVWMLKNDRVKPSIYVYKLLLSVCGRVGNVRKAFKVWKHLRSSKVPFTLSMYTSLFNACANSPDREEALKRAHNLRMQLFEKEIRPSLVTQKAMIKAFGMLGDLETAMAVADYMIGKKYKPDEEVFSFLLMACISDKDLGFRHAIKIWRTMHEMKVPPDVYHYNLLARVIKECGIGDQSVVNNLLQASPAASDQLDPVPTCHGKLNSASSKKLPSVTEGSQPRQQYLKKGASPVSETISVDPVSVDNAQIQEQRTKSATCENSQNTKNIVEISDLKESRLNFQIPAIPDVLNPRTTYSEVVSVDTIKTAEQRLAFLGGLEGFLARMAHDDVAPNIITFSQLMNVIPSDTQSEEKLLAVLDKLEIKPDVDFFNDLIRKRALRNSVTEARDVLQLISKHGLTPNMRTFASLAMTCSKLPDGHQLLADIESIGVQPNLAVYETLLYKSYMNFNYKLYLLRAMDKAGVMPAKSTLMQIEKHIVVWKENITKKRQQRFASGQSADEEKIFQRFMDYYQDWLKRTQLHREKHPFAKRINPKQKETEV